MGACLTLVMPYYLNAGMLRLQYAMWAAWPEALRNGLRVIIVDDGSPVPASDVERPDGLQIAIYRVLQDKPWHQHGARNLGAYVAPMGWLLLTDMDHVLSEESAAKLFEALPELDQGTVYMLDRVEADSGKPKIKDGKPHPHPNSFVMTREMFWKIGGYDERATGFYGTDRIFRERAFSIAKRGHLNIPLTRYWRDIIPDASTTTLPRKEGRDPAVKAKAMEEIRRAPEARVALNFEWERAC